MIACVSVPYFAAAVERREDPSLVARPLVIGGLPRTPGKVYAISREAARTGVRPGMPVRRAQGLCPQARFIPAAQARYQEVFEQIADLLTAFTNLVEPGDGHWQAADGRWRTTVSNDQLAATYSLDLGVLKETEAVEVVQQIGGAVRERARLAAAIGLARERFTAHVAATSVEPNEALLV
ncbi:MAG TPA: hypothetical protein DEP84_01295, partial [Chloroflexi bacterium]|nr:hypothetical protein [Chloroflexota bacterium]